MQFLHSCQFMKHPIFFNAFGMLTEQRKFFGIQDRESLKCSKR